GLRRRRRVPLADGARGDRRPDLLDRAVAGVRAGDVHGDGRFRLADLALRQEADRLLERLGPRWRSPREAASAATIFATGNRNRGGVGFQPSSIVSGLVSGLAATPGNTGWRDQS